MNTQQSDHSQLSTSNINNNSCIDVDLVNLEGDDRPTDKMTGMEMLTMDMSAATTSTIDSANAFSRSPTNHLLNQRIGDLSVNTTDIVQPMDHSFFAVTSSQSTSVSMTSEEHLLQVIQIKSHRIHELEQMLRTKDNEIAELTSHLDKFQSVFPFSNRGGRKTGVHGASGQRQRNIGISAEPQNETSALDMHVTFPKYEKDER